MHSDTSEQSIYVLKSRVRKCFVLFWIIVCLVAAMSQSPSQKSDAGYIDPAACAKCHQEIAESYARTGMARSFGMVLTGKEFPGLKGGDFYHQASAEHFTIFAKAGGLYLKRHQSGIDGEILNVLEAKIDYWFGSGNHARSYISRTSSGEFVELPLTWYAKGGYWAMSPGYDRPDHAGFSRKITYRCMFCHNAYPQA